jgi:hypothetical protein
VEKYFAARSLILLDGITGTVLRFHPACPWRDENTGNTIYIPALIAAFNVDRRRRHHGRAPHPSRSTRALAKGERRMFGVLHRAAVKLDPLGDTLHVGEGVETDLAARQLGYSTVWTLGSVPMITHFPLIPGVTRLRVLGKTGEASAGALKIVGRRWHQAGRKIEIVMPSVGSDLNDGLMAKAT